MKQKVVQKEKEKLKKENKVSTKLKGKERLALHLLLKQLDLLKMKEYLVLIGLMFGGALLRIPMQSVPSAEPITFFAILAGWLFGKKKGFLTGAGALYVSNFFMFGGQGPWTIFQALGFGVAGFFGGYLRKKAKWFEIMIVAGIATLAYEIIVNFGTLMFMPFSIFAIFFTALPFTLVHLVSNVIFSLGLGKAKTFVEEKGGFNEKKMCKDMIKILKNKNKNKTESENIYEIKSKIGEGEKE
ncbi:hypothetical protein ISS04_02315 [Candidatus Woesearchaeota archaeon]|nr:hypothetical protein [Candidatus Woesearchaeota archaeon]